MRSSLSQYHGAFVLCRGWILYWKDRPESNCRQVTIGKPCFKAPDPSKRFCDLELIAKEEHVNLFIPYEQLPSYDARFLLNEKIRFCGFIDQYTRSDGSTDFAVASITQNPVSRRIQKLHLQLKYAQSNLSRDTLLLIEEVILANVSELLQEIDDLGDFLPTFFQAKDDMVRELVAIRGNALKIQTLLNLRRYRRNCCRRKTSNIGALVRMHS